MAKLSAMQMFMEGSKFGVVGMIEEPSSYVRKDDATGSVKYGYRIAYTGGSLYVTCPDKASYDQIEKRYASVPAGTLLCRASGKTSRKPRSKSVVNNVLKIMFAGEPGWEDPKFEEIYRGCTFEGVGKFTYLRPYDDIGLEKQMLSMRIEQFGITHKFTIDPAGPIAAIINALPLGSMISYIASGSSNITKDSYGNYVEELTMILESIEPVVVRAAPPLRTDEKPAA